MKTFLVSRLVHWLGIALSSILAAVLLVIVISITALYVAYVDCDILLFEGILKFLGSGYFMIKSVPTFLVYYSAWLSAGKFSKFKDNF